MQIVDVWPIGEMWTGLDSAICLLTREDYETMRQGEARQYQQQAHQVKLFSKGKGGKTMVIRPHDYHKRKQEKTSKRKAGLALKDLPHQGMLPCVGGLRPCGEAIAHVAG